MQNRNCSKEILTIIIILPWFQACIYWKKVCYMTTSFTAIHFFYDSVIISWEHLKQSTCQENCIYFTILFATIHYNKRSAVDSRKFWIVSLFEENHCSPAVLKVPIYSTELVAIIFFFQKYCVKCTKALTETHSFMANQHSKFFGGLRAETWPVSRPFLLSTVLFYLKREIGRDRSFIFVTVLSSLRAAAWAIHSIV